MMIKHILKHTAATLMLTALALPSYGQDLLARQAPIDKKMRAVDSVAIQRLLERENIADLASTLYPDWESTSINRYANVELPQEVKIDLRHFCMPTTNRIVTSSYGYRPRFKRQHKGIDVNAYKGDTIRAAFDGKVRISEFQASGYGNVVVLRHPNGLETVYGHFSKRLVPVGVEVKAGDPIGLAGNTGRSTATHLHFETRLCGEYIDPALLFDFKAQDVTGDFYVWRKHGRGKVLDQHEADTQLAENATTSEEQPSTEAQATTKTKANSNARNNVRTRNHKVKKGETLYSIARAHGTTVAKICRMNGLSTRAKIRPGQILKYS